MGEGECQVAQPEPGHWSWLTLALQSELAAVNSRWLLDVLVVKQPEMNSRFLKLHHIARMDILKKNHALKKVKENVVCEASLSPTPPSLSLPVRTLQSI